MSDLADTFIHSWHFHAKNINFVGTDGYRVYATSDVMIAKA